MTHPTRAFSGSIINRFTGSKILARVGQISVAFPHDPTRIISTYSIEDVFNLFKELHYRIYISECLRNMVYQEVENLA